MYGPHPVLLVVGMQWCLPGQHHPAMLDPGAPGKHAAWHSSFVVQRTSSLVHTIRASAGTSRAASAAASPS